MTDVELTKLGDLYPKSVFRIPRYQRGYSWTKKQITDLVEDLEYTLEQRNTEGKHDFTHYFGTVVLQDTGVVEGKTRNFESYDIIDGQQRLTTVSIFVSCLNEQLEAISPDSIDDESVPPVEIADENRDEFIVQHGTERITLDSLNDSTFQKIVIQGDPLNNVAVQNLVQRRLKNAKSEVTDWLERHREDSSDDQEYYEFLRDLGKVIKNGFELTTYVIDDETEAGRLFEVVNDRGKDLTTLDKIKSYLVYCAARHDDIELSKEVYRKVGEVIRNITEKGGSDNDIEVFVGHHWKLFSGELNRFRQSNTEYVDIHRRIKHLRKHASIEQNQEAVRLWINTYLESLTTCSEIYKKIEHPHLLQEDDDSELASKIVADMEGLNELPVAGNFYPLLMAVYRRFGVGSELATVVNLCEKLSFRVYNIANRRTDAAKVSLSRHAYWIEWAARREEAEAVFSDRQNSLKFDDSAEAVQETCKMIESEIGDHCPDTYFVRCLLRNDIIEGSDANDGWTGVRNNNSIKYLLYRYEKHLRVSGSQSSLSQIPSYTQWKQEGISLEHIYPQNPEQQSESLSEVCNSLGNLALLGPEDNSGAGNADYQYKHTNIYSKSSMKMLESLPDPSTGWDVDSINQRGRDIVEFALNEWGALSKAHIHVSSAPKDIDETKLTEVAHDVRSDYKQRYGFSIPSVHIQSTTANGDGSWNIIHSCPTCDSTLVELHSVDGWDASCAGCGEELDRPVYKVNVDSYEDTSQELLITD